MVLQFVEAVGRQWLPKSGQRSLAADFEGTIMKTTAHKRYRLRDSTIVPGTTTVVALLAKPALIAWANRKGLEGVSSARYTDNLADVGILAHAFITDDLRGRETDTRDYSENQIEQAKNCVKSYTSWAASHKIEPVLTEEPLVSEEHRFGGTLDLFAVVSGTNELIDFKATNGIWPEHIVQVSAYRQLLQEAGYKVERIRILNIPRSPTESFSELIPSDTVLDLNWEIFTCLLKVYELRRKLK